MRRVMGHIPTHEPVTDRRAERAAWWGTFNPAIPDAFNELVQSVVAARKLDDSDYVSRELIEYLMSALDEALTLLGMPRFQHDLYAPKSVQVEQ